MGVQCAGVLLALICGTAAISLPTHSDVTQTQEGNMDLKHIYNWPAILMDDQGLGKTFKNDAAHLKHELISYMMRKIFPRDPETRERLLQRISRHNANIPPAHKRMYWLRRSFDPIQYVEDLPKEDTGHEGNEPEEMRSGFFHSYGKK